MIALVEFGVSRGSRRMQGGRQQAPFLENLEALSEPFLYWLVLLMTYLNYLKVREKQ